ncbi:transcriptional regulator, LysR family [Shimia gijangensis]|uniref:Transcriptional regulator, LysR family n=1 Tax=Shimia gijangensis TaxID=1470563 RepID=A0A1M6BC84_9RHOB|nr:LysR family transcriptional regulator [Shimia gijangensis]SHI46339.1 transcriptional regulator, LysR family [Shimia gijangensis]
MDKLAFLDWSLIQSFLAVAETGSLSGAARQLGTSQPTLGRQIRTLEKTLGVEVFHRHARGLELTRLGRDMVPAAQAMHQAMNDLSLAAAGAQSTLEGDVRITTSVFMAHHVLPGILADIRETEPDIRIDLVASDDSDNLLFREADIAVRMYRPRQLDMVTRHLGDIPLGLFAARSYIDRKGAPTTPQDLQHHDLVGYDRSDLIVRSMRDAGLPAQRDWFKVRCDNQTAYWELVRAGCGIGFSQSHTALSDPNIVELVPGLPIPPLPVWLTAHEVMRQTPRIARIWDLLSAGLRPFVS